MNRQYSLLKCYCKHCLKGNGFIIGCFSYLVFLLIVFSAKSINAQSTPNLVSHWKFDMGAGQTVKDHSGNNIDATLGSTSVVDKNDPIWEVGCCGNSVKSAIWLDGIDDYVEVDNSAINAIGTGDFTMEAFFKVKNFLGDPFPTILSNRKNSTKEGFLLFFIWSGQTMNLTFQIDGKNHQFPSTPNVFDDHCHHVAVSRVVNKLNFFIDGTLVHTKQIGNNLNIGTSHPLWIGQDAKGSKKHAFKGIIEEVKIWNIAKVPAEIQQSYASGPTCPSAPTNLSSFPSIEKKLKGGFYRVEDTGILKFRYIEEYNDQDKQLTYQIYNRKNIMVTSNSKQPLMVQYGLNEYLLDLSCNGDALHKGFHVLEVINEKKEKWYLRFLLEKDYKADCP